MQRNNRCKDGPNCTAKVPVEVRKDKARRDRRDEGVIAEKCKTTSEDKTIMAMQLVQGKPY